MKKKCNLLFVSYLSRHEQKIVKIIQVDQINKISFIIQNIQNDYKLISKPLKSYGNSYLIYYNQRFFICNTFQKFKKTDIDNFDLEQYQDTLNGKCQIYRLSRNKRRYLVLFNDGLNREKNQFEKLSFLYEAYHKLSIQSYNNSQSVLLISGISNSRAYQIYWFQFIFFSYCFIKFEETASQRQSNLLFLFR
ncbi:hypothetical protein pb186bvf_020571 [Paramecium bursaria]